MRRVGAQRHREQLFTLKTKQIIQQFGVNSVDIWSTCFKGPQNIKVWLNVALGLKIVFSKTKYLWHRNRCCYIFVTCSKSNGLRFFCSKRKVKLTPQSFNMLHLALPRMFSLGIMFASVLKVRATLTKTVDRLLLFSLLWPHEKKDTTCTLTKSASVCKETLPVVWSH